MSDRKRLAARPFSSIVAVLCAIGSSAVAAEPPVTAIAFAPDRKAVVAGSQQGIGVYRWPELTRLRSLDAAFANVHDLAFSPDGAWLAVAGGDPGEVGGVEILSWPEGKPLVRLAEHADAVYDADWSRDSKRLATAGLDRRVLLWNVGAGTLEREFAGHSKGVTAVCLLADDAVLVSAGIDQSLRVWETASGKLLRTLDNHTAAVHGLAVRPSEEGLPLLVSCSDDRTVRFWQPTIGRMMRFARLDAVPLAVAWVPGKPLVVAATSAATVVFIDAETAAVTREVPLAQGSLYSLAIDGDGRRLLAGGGDGELHRAPLVE